MAERLKGVRSQRETTHFCPWQLVSKNNQTIDFPLGCQNTPAFLQSLSGCGFVVSTFDRSRLRLKWRERSLDRLHSCTRPHIQAYIVVVVLTVFFGMACNNIPVKTTERSTVKIDQETSREQAGKSSPALCYSPCIILYSGMCF